MSNLFAPDYTPPTPGTEPTGVQGPLVPRKVKPVRPVLVRPTGPPVPELQALGFHGSIDDFAANLAATLASPRAQARGVLPSASQALSTALQPPPGVQGPARPTAVQDNGRLLEAMVGNAKAGALDQFMQDHGDQIDTLLHDPVYRARTAAVITEAHAYDRMGDAERRGGTLSSLVKDVGVNAPLKTARFARATERALAIDTANLGLWAATGGQKGSASFSNLEKAAPAFAQVVKGLVYSPVGLAHIAAGLDADLRAAGGGSLLHRQEPDFSFKHTRANATGLAGQFLEDLAHPESRAGYLFLDALAAGSLGAGAVTRVGRAGGALREGGGLGEAVRAARAPHPTRTKTLASDGMSEQIRLAQNPAMRMAQDWWYDMLQRRADERSGRRAEGRPTFTDLFGQEHPDFFPEGSFQQRIARWNPLTLEKTIGRAHNIRVANQIKTMTAVNALLHDTFGSAARRTALERVIPDSIFKGLNAGEMKALEVMSYDVSQGLDPFAVAERNAQFAMENGLGDTRAWQRQIQQLGLARKAMENPSSRFQAALEQIQKVNAGMEALKADAGWLTPEAMSTRVAKAGALVEHFPQAMQGRVEARKALADAQEALKQDPENQDLRDAVSEATDAVRAADQQPLFVNLPEDEGGGAALMVGDTPVPINRNRDDSWYFMFAPKSKAQIKRGTTITGNEFTGIAPGSLPSEITHAMSGEAYISGDYRIDLHNLAAEQLARTARAFAQINEARRAFQNGHEDYRPGDIPVRDTRNLPPELRRALNQFTDEKLDLRAVEELPPQVADILFPSQEETMRIAAEGGHVRYIDPRLLGTTIARGRDVGRAASAAAKVNDILRPLIFYLYPKYALNAVGNYGMLAFDQGFMRSYANLIRAMNLEKTHTPEDVAKIRTFVGSGKSEAFASAEKTGKVNKALAEWWNSMTDERFREASWLYQAHAKGFRTPKEQHELLTDPAHAEALNDVNRRANEALVAFDRMAPWEKAWLRNYVFVYPWQRGAFLWSFRSLFEHPAKSALLATLGEEAYHDEKWLKDAVDWVRRAGYIPLVPKGDKLHVWNATSVNTFQTLNDAMQAIKAQTVGDRYTALGDLLGPPGQFAVHAALGVDEYGNPYEGPQFLRAAKGALTTIPLVAAYQAKIRADKRAGREPAPVDVRKLGDLIRRQNGYLKSGMTNPGFLGGFGRLIYGPDPWLNMPAVAAAYWRDQPIEVRRKHEDELVQKMLTFQGEYLDRKVPADVRAAVQDNRDFHRYVKKWVDSNPPPAIGGTWPLPKQMLQLRIDYYASKGKISKEEQASLSKRASKLGDEPGDISGLNAKLAATYGNMDELAAWQREVGKVYSTVRDFDYRAGVLNRLGIGRKSYDLSKDERLEYGREVAEYERERGKFIDGKPTAAERREFIDSHDKPVRIGGKTLPSPVRFGYSDGSSDEIESRVAHLAGRSWSHLTLAEKALLGREPARDAQDGWRLYERSVDASRQQNGSVSFADKVNIARQVGRRFPGFEQDFLYSRRTRAQRFEETPAYKALADTPVGEMVAQAQKVGDLMEKVRRDPDLDYTITDLRAAWHAYVARILQPWLLRHPELGRALQPYGDRFLNGLVENG